MSVFLRAPGAHRPVTSSDRSLPPTAALPPVLLGVLLCVLLAATAHAGDEGRGMLPPDDAPATLFDENLFDQAPPAPPSSQARRARRIGGSWTAQGPGPTRFGQTENVSPDNEVTGAIHSAAAHPVDSDILYAAGANGGIWKTFDATSASPTWTPLTDNQASTSIGALELDPSDPDIVIVGHGRPSSFGGAGGKKNGVLYSTNGGNAWTVIDDPLLVDENISGVAARGATLVAVSRDSSGGLFRSTDTGASWSELSGDGSSGLPAGDYFDLVGVPGVTTRLYTAVEDDGVYRSDDTGATWTKISSSDATLDGFLTNFANNNTELAVAGNGRLYVGVIHNGQLAHVSWTANPTAGSPTWNAMDLPLMPEGTPASISGATNATPIVVTSTGHGLSSGREINVSAVTGNTAANGVFNISVLDADSFELDGSVGNGAYTGGGQWTLVTGLNPREKPGFQGSIHFAIAAHPTDPTLVFVGGDRQDNPVGFPNFIGATNFTGNLMRGDTDVAPTGAVPSPQWEHMTHRDDIAEIPGGGTASSSAPHADSREMVFDADGDMIETDDGGIYRRTNPTDNTGDWFSIIGNLGSTEFHDIAYDTLSDIIIGGAQDTGTPQQSATGSLVWDSVSTADGGDVAVDTTGTPGSSLRYSSFQFLGSFRRSTYNALGVLTAVTFPSLTVIGGGDPLSTQFVTPVETNAIDGTRLVIGGANGVYESTDQGDTITAVGPGIVANRDSVAYGGRRLGADNEDVLYVGDGATVYVRSSGGGSLTATAAAYPGGFIRDIVLDNEDWMTAVVIDEAGVYRTTDAGASWTDITGDLAAVGASNYRAVEFIVPTGAIVVGAREGVYATDPASLGTWNELGTDLASAPVYDLDYDPSDDVLVAGTLGRGAWLLTQVGGVCVTLDCTHLDDDCNVGVCNEITEQCEAQTINEGGACDTANVCTTNTCVLGSCVGVNNVGPCDDGVYCNGADTCAAGACSSHAGDPCAPASECATCNEVGDSCFDPAGTACSDDGQPCTIDECDGAGACAHTDASAAAGGCGDDTFGHRCDDSGDTVGPGFDFEDIASSGTPLFLADDQLSGSLPIGFSFEYYGASYTQIYVCSNGFVSFLAGACPFNSAAIPSTDSPDALVAAFWEDLNPTLGGEIDYQTVGTAPTRRLIVQFTDIQHFGGGSATTFQVKLFENSNRIEVHYLSAVSDGGIHAVGIENASGTDGIEVLSGDPGTLASYAIAFDLGVRCDDADACTTNDLCSGGSCTGDAVDALPCDDGVFCNGADSCTAGSCDTHAGDPCAGGGACNETCNEGSDDCFDPVETTCTSDGNECTDDECDGAGTCTNTNNTEACDDGAFCNGADTCSGGTCSVHSGDPCSGGSECADACNEGADDCFDVAGSGCTSDGNECTDDECDGAGTCANTNNAAACDDGVFCNGADTCDAGTCSAHAGDPCAGGADCQDLCDEGDDDCLVDAGTACTDDGNQCTDDTCDGAGTCSHDDNTEPCDDGVACTVSDVCSAGVCQGDPSGCDALDHYKLYKSKTAKNAPDFDDVTVVTENDFETKVTIARKPAFVGNPADRDGEGILNAEVHMECYKAREDGGQERFDGRILDVTNPLTTQRLELSKLRYLCLPTATSTVAPPGPLAPHAVDPFKCYRAKPADGEPKFGGTTVNLVDEFLDKDAKVEKSDVVCAPTDIDAAGVANPFGYLHCYKTKDVSGDPKFSKTDVFAENDFGAEQLQLKKAKLLCLPASVVDLGAP